MSLISRLKLSPAKLLDLLLSTLDSDDREAVVGDLFEENESLGGSLLQVWSLVIRRQIRPRSSVQPWLILCAVTVPVAVLLAQAARGFASWSAVYSWMTINNSDPTLLSSCGYWQTAMDSSWKVGKFGVMLLACSWICGRLLGKVATKTRYSMALLFTFASLFVTIVSLPSHVHFLRMPATDAYLPNGPVFANAFYRNWFPLIVYAFSVLFPLLSGVLHPTGSKRSKTENALWRVTVGLVMASLIEQPWMLFEMWGWRIVPTKILHLPSLLPAALLATTCFFFLEFVEAKRGRSPIS